ncbi:MAG: RAMP superfamily CRISPR-associated protein, partial [Candidatus Hodarchaeales archaeon]
MQKMKISLLLRAETPIILGSKIPFQGINYSSQHFITASSIRGAVLTAFKEKTCIVDNGKCEKCDKISECEFQTNILPNIDLISPGNFQCPNCGGYNTLNKVYSTYNVCKTCKIEYKKSQDSRAKNYSYEVTSQLLDILKGEKDERDLLCGNKRNPHVLASAKSESGYVCLDCKQIFKGPETKRMTNITIDSESRTAKEEHLFFYEVLPAGLKFSIEIILSHGTINYVENLKRVFLGRGSSRGFGWIRIESMSSVPISEILHDFVKILKDQRKNFDNIVLISKTPVTSIELDMDKQCFVSVPYV